MKQRLLLSLSLLLSLIAAAAPVSLQQARQKAEAQLKGKNLVVAAQARQMSKGEAPPYYVFNVENNGGFVIVSGDDRVPDILGYSDKGNLDLDRLPPNVAWWLSGYQKQLEAISQDASAAARAMEPTRRAKVNPLVMTEWGQGYPYNDMCPVVNGQKCLTGCVATAMAQIMYYHHAPASACKSIFIPAVDHNLQYLDRSQLPSTTFDWSNMLLNYLQGSNDVQNKAVAKLMQYCGRALFMRYGLDVSLSADENIKLRLNDTFGYDNVSFVSRNNFSDEEWESLIYNELSARRPVAYSGDDEVSGGGHCFVCDGYDGEGMFHINWGWYGNANGFYRLSALIPNGYPNGFTGGQSAVIGIKSSDMAPGAVMKADDIVCEQGEEIGELTWTSGTMTIPQGTPKLSTTATKDSPVGIYPIIISRGSITENDLKLVNGKLTIVKTENPITYNLSLKNGLTCADLRPYGINYIDMNPATVVNPADRDYIDGFRFEVKVKNGTQWATRENRQINNVVPANGSIELSLPAYEVVQGGIYRIALLYNDYIDGRKQEVELGHIALVYSEAITITADSKTMIYGSKIPTLTYTSTGGMVNGTPKLSTTATSSSPVGTYPIRVERGTVTNQDVSYVDGTLTILQNTNDLTSRVGITAQNWNTNAMVEWAGPTIITRDGRETALAEKYAEPATVTGNVLSQTVNGLENGKYEVTLYANACFTPGRGFSSNVTEGQQDVVYVYANDSKQFIPVHRLLEVTQHGEYTLTTNVTNGTLRLGMYAEKTGTNWHSIQIKSLDRLGEIESPVKKGDLNGDGKVSITDVVMIVDVIAGIITDANQRAAADVNGDGSVTITDCVAAIDVIAAQQTAGVRMATAPDMPYNTDVNKPTRGLNIIKGKKLSSMQRNKMHTSLQMDQNGLMEFRRNCVILPSR